MHADDQALEISRACGLKNYAFAATLKAAYVEGKCCAELLAPSEDASYGLATLTRFPILQTRRMMFQREELAQLADVLDMRQEQPRGAMAAARR